MDHDPLQPLENDTLRTRVTDSVRQAILQGILLPGGQVNQAQIAAKLGISRGPLREALRQLEEEGLVQSYPHRGTFVTEITPAYIEEVYSIRRVLETFAVTRMMAHDDTAIVAQLGHIVEGMQAAAREGNLTRLNELDFEFHAAIIRGAEHNLLTQLWKSIEVGVKRVVTLRHGIYDNLDDIVGNHPDMLAAIKAGDSLRASALLDTHIRDAGEQVYQAWLNLPSVAATSPLSNS